MTRDDEPVPIRLGLGISGLMGFGGLLLYFFWPQALDWTLLPIPAEVRWAGATVAVMSVLSTWWVFRTLGLNVTRTSKTRDNATLVTTRALSVRASSLLRQRRAGVRRAVTGDAQLVVHRVDCAGLDSVGRADAKGRSQPRSALRRRLARVCRSHRTFRSAPRAVNNPGVRLAVTPFRLFLLAVAGQFLFGIVLALPGTLFGLPAWTARARLRRRGAGAAAGRFLRRAVRLYRVGRQPRRPRRLPARAVTRQPADGHRVGSACRRRSGVRRDGSGDPAGCGRRARSTRPATRWSRSPTASAAARCSR